MKLSSILTKVLMAVTGLLWLGFVISHLTANLQMFAGPATFNAYPELLRKAGYLLWVAEAGLVLFLVMHIVSAFRITTTNRAARPVGYESNANLGKSTLASRTMAIGGVIILVFIITHVKMFKFGDWTMKNGLWGLVMDTFSHPLMVAWYLLAMAALGLHLSHGFGSAFQTLGILKPDWTRALRKAGYGIGWLIAVGFAIIPIWAYMNKGS